MNIGSVIDFYHDNEVKTGQVYTVHNNNYYDVIGLNERNIPLESVIGIPAEDTIVKYYKKDYIYDVYIIKIDKWSQSAQIKMFYRNVTPYSMSENRSQNNNGYCNIL